MKQCSLNLGQIINVIMKVILLGEWHAPSANTCVRTYKSEMHKDVKEKTSIEITVVKNTGKHNMLKCVINARQNDTRLKYILKRR